jgi:hypothetical protein
MASEKIQAPAMMIAPLEEIRYPNLAAEFRVRKFATEEVKETLGVRPAS